MEISLIADTIAKHGRKRESLLPILQDVCQQNSYLTLDLMRAIAEELDMSAADVYGVASFYSFLPLEHRGRYTIKVCQTISCEMKNKLEIISTLKHLLKIDFGETTSDNLFSLVHTNCIGQCDRAPSMLINDQPYTQLTPDRVREIVDSYRRGTPIVESFK